MFATMAEIGLGPGRDGERTLAAVWTGRPSLSSTRD